MDGIADSMMQRLGERVQAVQRTASENEASIDRAARLRLADASAQADGMVKVLEQKLAAIAASRSQVIATEAELRDLLSQQSAAMLGQARDALTNLHQQIRQELGGIDEAVKTAEAKQR
jgi:hypothetical protein